MKERDIMEIKPWDQYSFSEKRILLNFWFAYSNRNQDILTKEDREYFNHLLERDIDLILDFIVILTTLGHNAETMIQVMRNGSLDKLLADAPRMDDEEDYQFMKKQVITMLVGLCNITMATTDEQEITTGAVELGIKVRREITKHYFS